jgi:hypothetical protein
VAGGADIQFSDNGPFAGITHTAGTSGVTVPIACNYDISYSASITAGIGSQIAIAVNGAVDSSTPIQALVATGQFGGRAILPLAAGDVITLRNNSGTSLTTTLAPAVGAQLTVECLDP